MTHEGQSWTEEPAELIGATARELITSELNEPAMAEIIDKLPLEYRDELVARVQDIVEAAFNAGFTVGSEEAGISTKILSRDVARTAEEGLLSELRKIINTAAVNL